MKLKPSVKWAIAAAATVTTVTVSMGVIASAYPYDQGVTSGDGFGILPFNSAVPIFCNSCFRSGP